MLTPPGSMQKDRAEWVKTLGLFSVIAADLIGYTAVGVGLGYLAWKKAGAPWWVLLLTSMASLALAFYRVYLVSQKLFSDSDSGESKGSDKSNG